MRYVIRERFFRLGEDSDITDDGGRPAYNVDGKILTLRDTVIIRDLAGVEVAKVERRLMALRPTYEITRDGQELAEVRKKLFSPFADRYTIDVPGPDDLDAVGDIFDHEYRISRAGYVVATVSKSWLSLTETYGVEIVDGEDNVLILASVLAFDLANDRERTQ